MSFRRYSRYASAGVDGGIVQAHILGESRKLFMNVAACRARPGIGMSWVERAGCASLIGDDDIEGIGIGALPETRVDLHCRADRDRRLARAVELAGYAQAGRETRQ